MEGELVAISKEIRNEAVGPDGASQDNGNTMVYQCRDLEAIVDDGRPPQRETISA